MILQDLYPLQSSFVDRRLHGARPGEDTDEREIDVLLPRFEIPGKVPIRGY